MKERACVQVKQLIDHCLENPKYYPGPHNLPAPRTSQGLQQLDTRRQMLLIWDALCQYIAEALEAGRAVNVPNFGAFTFEQSLQEDGGHPSNPRKASRHLRPCFLVHDKLKRHLYRYPGKEEVRTGRNEVSVYQHGRLEFLNVVPIAAGCYYTTPIVTSAITQLFRAIGDLAQRNYNLDLNFGFCRVRVHERDLQVGYARRLTETSNAAVQMQSTPSPISKTWQEARLSKSMMNFVERPNSAEVRRKRNRTKHLGVVSCDMCSISLDGKSLMAR
mmetsp:Transcript_9186/g.20012  ORF Transcript_9186/g.20012 Transcript_9186/m.20012 type:complete len:274 (-) Transcript_9186:176-997(-)